MDTQRLKQPSEGLYAVVLAGGSGTRLWPYSRSATPKQLLRLVGERSMLEIATQRLSPLVPPERLFILTGAAHVEEVRRALPDVPADQIVGEPAALGTAAAVGLGLALVRARDPEALFCVVTADHLIEPEPVFRSALASAAEVASHGHLVTFGIKPSRPDTGFGYVELGPALSEPIAADGAAMAYEVAAFVEKPDLATAEAYLSGGRHVWNSGMFAWSVASLGEAFAKHLPALSERIEEITAIAGQPGFETNLGGIWARIEDRTTIDYGIMERADRVACVPAAFDWQDIGSWLALHEALPRDGAGNAIVGEHLGVDTRGSLIFAPSGRLVATIGLEDMIVVDTGDALLVCPLDRAQEVKTLVERLKSRADTRHL